MTVMLEMKTTNALSHEHGPVDVTLNGTSSIIRERRIG